MTVWLLVSAGHLHDLLCPIWDAHQWQPDGRLHITSCYLIVSLFWHAKTGCTCNYYITMISLQNLNMSSEMAKQIQLQLAALSQWCDGTIMRFRLQNFP